jgi:hypothetical protein
MPTNKVTRTGELTSVGTHTETGVEMGALAAARHPIARAAAAAGDALTNQKAGTEVDGGKAAGGAAAGTATTTRTMAISRRKVTGTIIVSARPVAGMIDRIVRRITAVGIAAEVMAVGDDSAVAVVVGGQDGRRKDEAAGDGADIRTKSS